MKLKIVCMSPKILISYYIFELDNALLQWEQSTTMRKKMSEEEKLLLIDSNKENLKPTVVKKESD